MHTTLRCRMCSPSSTPSHPISVPKRRNKYLVFTFQYTFSPGFVPCSREECGGILKFVQMSDGVEAFHQVKFTDSQSLGRWVVSSLVELEQPIADSDTLVGNKSGHGLTSRPRESAGTAFLDELLLPFGSAGKSGADLLNGTLNLKYCTAAFARKMSTGSLPVPVHVPFTITVDDG